MDNNNESSKSPQEAYFRHLMEKNKNDLSRFFFSPENKNKFIITSSLMGVIVFMLTLSFFSFNDGVFSTLYPKEYSKAAPIEEKPGYVIDAPKVVNIENTFLVDLKINPGELKEGYFSAKIQFNEKLLQVVNVNTNNLELKEKTVELGTNFLTIKGYLNLQGNKAANLTMASLMIKPLRRGETELIFDIKESFIRGRTDNRNQVSILQPATVVIIGP